ncbi:MAG: trimethylamine methyltransferase family protein [Ardenticatenaceae bacterium]|nr:trimethylamine methyltransferase family protein [Ardenticatenaceae bacterium]
MARARSSRRARRGQVGRQSLTPQIVKIVQPVVNIPTYDLLSDEAIEEIHQKSLEILSDVGIDFYDDDIHAVLKSHGVQMKGDTAFFDREMVEEYISKAPAQFVQQARDQTNNVTIGGDHICFAPVYGPPFVHDLDRGRREATLEDFVNFVKLTYQSEWLHFSGGTIVEPTDLPTHTRHLDMVYSHLKYSNKAIMGSVTSAENAADSIAMAEIVFGKEKIRETPAVMGLINISSPRRLDDRMLGALKTYVRAGQAVLITPFLFSGAMAPVGIAGTLVQLNAEALSGIILAQMINPGNPVIMGAFQTNIDLQSGAPVFGSPESQVALFAAAQLARRHELPFRSGGHFSSSKIPDAQAAYESTSVMLATALARVNFVLHAAGWLEGGLTAGYEKFVMDNEQLGMFHKLYGGLDMSDNGFAMDSLRSVAVTDHHLGTEHTMKNFRTAFHRSLLYDYNSYEQWFEEGAKRSDEKANGKWKEMLRLYEPPPLDPAIDEALQAFMARRKEEIPPEF